LDQRPAVLDLQRALGAVDGEGDRRARSRRRASRALASQGGGRDRGDGQRGAGAFEKSAAGDLSHARIILTASGVRSGFSRFPQMSPKRENPDLTPTPKR